MNEKPSIKQVLELYLKHVVSEARTASEDLMGSFLIKTRFRGGYIKVQILFVCYTDQLDIETEIETWFKIYKWVEDKKDELLHRYEVEDSIMIVLYPRFINFKEYWSLPRDDKTRLDKNKIAWYKAFNSFR